MANRIYIADKETLDATHANTKAILAQVGDSDYFKPKRYGYKVNKNDSNPKTRISYIFDAADFLPASMNYATGTFDYGSWGDIWFIKDNFPCMLKFDGTVDYKLDPNDYSLREDGTASDVANTAYQGNAMSAMPTVWYSQYEIGNYEYHVFCEEKYDETYHAYAHERADGSIMNYRYFRMFEGFSDGTRLRSLSGQTPTVSQTGATELARATANGDLWTTTTWNIVNLMKGLLTLISKSDDSQTAFGNGNCNGDEYLTTGQLNDKGQFFGYNTTTQAVKVFHIENWWGNYWERIRGYICDKGAVKVAMKPPYNNDGSGYIDTGVRFSGNSGGYVKETLNGEFGRIPCAVGGSSSTYTCDYSWWNDAVVGYALFGGRREDGLSCGALSLTLNNAFSYSYTYIAASLSCEEPLQA